MCPPVYDATVPFGNFWKAVIFGIINRVFFFFFFFNYRLWEGGQCSKMLLTYVVIWKNLILFFKVYIYINVLTEKNQIDLNLKRQRNQKWVYFYK